eukprot:1095679-Pyramimonas_sp.AAC.1
MALRRPGGDDLNPDRGPIKRHRRCTPGAPASPSFGPDHLKPKKKKRKIPDDPDLGDSKRCAGQPAEQRADRQRSRGPAVAAAAAILQVTSMPTPKEHVPRRGPTPGRTQ